MSMAKSLLMNLQVNLTEVVLLIMTLQNAPVGLDYERDKKFQRGFKRSLWQHGAWGLGNRALFLVFFVKFRKYPVKFEFES
uniref:Uncharacterized protein n=1 Tax=Helianthus annuus TaxID=4232 RepID=A0A251TPJ9_HELAN